MFGNNEDYIFRHDGFSVRWAIFGLIIECTWRYYIDVGYEIIEGVLWLYWRNVWILIVACKACGGVWKF